MCIPTVGMKVKWPYRPSAGIVRAVHDTIKIAQVEFPPNDRCFCFFRDLEPAIMTFEPDHDQI